MIGKLSHKEALSNLGRTCEKIRSRIENTLDYRKVNVKGRFIKLVHRNGLQIGGVIRQKPLSLKIVRKIVKPLVFFFGLCYNICVNIVEWLSCICANRCCKGSHFFFAHTFAPFIPSIVTVIRLIVSSNSGVISPTVASLRSSASTSANCSLRAL